MTDLGSMIEASETTYSEEFQLDIQPNEVLAAVKGVKKCKPDVKSLPKKIYKQCAEVLVLPISIIFMLILKTGVVPEMIKIADC